MTPSVTQRSASLLVLAMAIGVLGGCQKQAKTPPNFDTPVNAERDYQPLDQLTADAVYGEQSQAGASERTYLLTLGSREGETFKSTLVTEADRWRRTDEGHREVAGLRNDEGVFVSEEDDLESDSAISYDPPLLIFPTTIKRGETYEAESKMVVKSIQSGAAKESGACSISIELLGGGKVQTPAGAFDAVFVRVKRKIDLKLANVEVTVVTAFAEGRGMVAEHIIRKTRAIGIFGSTKIEEKRLAK